MNILVVEDEFLIAVSIEEILREAGEYEVTLAATVAEALNCLEKESIDLAVLDMNLRGETSAPVCDACAGAGIPFLILSGYNSAQIAKNSHAAPVLGKPYDPAALVAAVQGLAQKRDAARQR